MEVWLATEPVEQPTHWAGVWSDDSIQRSVVALQQGRDPVAALLRRLVADLPPGAALDHGCGFGRVSAYLHEVGWRPTGVDFVLKHLRRVRDVVPDVHVVQGDIRRLPMDDGAFDLAVSLGVVEHVAEGPGEALRELRRVLRPGARALVSVPYHNPLRRFLARRDPPAQRTRDEYRIRRVAASTEGMTHPGFYQYAFTREEFGFTLTEAGFRVVDAVPYAVLHGLADLEAGMRLQRHLRSRFGDGRGEKNGVSRPRRSLRASAASYLREVYDETGRTMPARWSQQYLGRLCAHMLGFFAVAE